MREEGDSEFDSRRRRSRSGRLGENAHRDPGSAECLLVCVGGCGIQPEVQAVGGPGAQSTVWAIRDRHSDSDVQWKKQ